MNKSFSEARGEHPQPFPVDDKTFKLPNFKAELSDVDIAKLLPKGSGIVVFPFGPIDALSPTKMVGHGETNITLIWPTIVQTDTNGPPPFATFDMTQSGHPGAVSMHFVPSAYGITSTATYVMEFNIQTFGSTTLNLAGYVGTGSLSNTGTKVINGSATVQMVMHNVQPYQVTWGALQQISGAPWNWYSTVIRFPQIVISANALHP